MMSTKCKLGELVDVTRGMSLSGQYYSEEGELIRLTLGNFNMNGGGFKKKHIQIGFVFYRSCSRRVHIKKGRHHHSIDRAVVGIARHDSPHP